eukprot:scaffold6513_cov125-Isochrysis_galbana.AAC.7
MRGANRPYVPTHRVKLHPTNPAIRRRHGCVSGQGEGGSALDTTGEAEPRPGTPCGILSDPACPGAPCGIMLDPSLPGAPPCAPSVRDEIASTPTAKAAAVRKTALSCRWGGTPSVPYPECSSAAAAGPTTTPS